MRKKKSRSKAHPPPKDHPWGARRRFKNSQFKTIQFPEEMKEHNHRNGLAWEAEDEIL